MAQNTLHILNSIPGIQAREQSLLLIAGPCAIENETTPRLICDRVKSVSEELGLSFIFKGSYKKANRSSVNSFTGIGDKIALNILKSIGEEYSVPTITDVHSPDEARKAAAFVDVLQIPAFLCRQTELLVAAANTGKAVNIKKGQFLSPEAMKFAAEKVLDSGNPNVMLTERGTTFGYQDLVVDFRGIPLMKKMGYPVIMDCTHALQQPNQGSGVTGGKPELIETIAKAAVAAGVDGLFIETHPSPKDAKSDGANMLPLEELEPLLRKVVKLRKALF